MPNIGRIACLAIALSLGSLPALSAVPWQIGEGAHPTLGSIRFASPKAPITTPVGSASVSSRAYVSCVRSNNRIAIELAHATAPDDPGGLQPRTLPTLLCNRRAAKSNRLVQSELPARWAISDIGDVLARGFEPRSLRECVSIHVVQDVALPKGWARESARVAFDIDPYSRELDSIFVTCGETSATGPAAPAATTVAAASPAPPPAPARSTDAAWKAARTIASGRTNVRARPAVDAALVVQLNPGEPVLVQPAGADWWRARPSAGAKFDGYIRGDRLVFK
jgi:hypothetical protein